MERTKEREALARKLHASIVQSSTNSNSLAPTPLHSGTTEHHGTVTFHQAENLEPKERLVHEQNATAPFELNENLQSKEMGATKDDARVVPDMAQNVAEIEIGNSHFNWMPVPLLNTLDGAYTTFDFGDDFHMLPQDSDKEGENTTTSMHDTNVDFAIDKDLFDALNYECDRNDLVGGICDVFTEKQTCESTTDIKCQSGTSEKKNKDAREEETVQMKRSASIFQGSLAQMAEKRAAKRLWERISRLKHT
jgi:hypothetical protein